MVSTADVCCILIFAAMILVEGQRGVVLALIDFVGLLVGVVVVREAYVPLAVHFGSASVSYMVLFGVAVLAVIIASVYLAKAVKFQVTGGDAAAGALLGICSATVLCFALFEILTIRYGSGSGIVSGSLLRGQFYDFAAFRAVADFVRTLMGKK
jgi:hypothetical protein